ncbi:MAG: ATP-binding protein, partial [Desulfurococcales archaeon]|nr:ATP-binding protein [Desulfurococcales archaeon]
MLFIKFAIVMLIALISVYAGTSIGEGPIPIILVLGTSLTALLYVRNADKLTLRRGEIGVSGLYSMALGDIKEVKHHRNMDVLSSRSGYVAIAAVEVVDVWNSYEVLDQRQLATLVSLHGEALGAIGGVEIQIEIIKRERTDPVFRYYIMAKSKREDTSISRAEAAIKELASTLSSLQITLRRVVCDGTPDGCGITRLINSELSGAPTSKAPGALQAALSVVAMVISLIAAPGVLPLVASMSTPAFLSGIYTAIIASRMGRGGRVAPVHPISLMISEGRLVAGSTWNSFATLRYVEHYDRVLNQEDIAKLISELNDFLYKGGSYHIRLSVRRSEEVSFQRKEALRMDMSHLDFETGGGLSKRIKAHKHEIRLERIRALGEKPFELYGVFIVKSAEGGETIRVKEDAFKSRLSVLGFRVNWVRNPLGIARCVRMLYVGPSQGLPMLEPASVEDVKALTLDFSWISPFAFDRSPQLVREGIYLGYDRRGRPVYWNPKALRNMHIGLFGPPGSGKSTIVKSLILRTARYFQAS